MGHSHAHGHGHDHAHGPARYDRAFAIGIALNLLYVLGEAGAGFWTGSVALLADAGHNLSDVAGLLVAWGGTALARRRPTKRFTYGLKGSTILAALANAVLLLVAVGAIALEAVHRLGEPAPVAGGTVAAVAAVGILVNGATAALFARGRHGDVNLRGAFLHMAADALVSAGVVAAGLAIRATGAGWIDPAVSLVVAGVVLWQTAGLLRETLEMSLQAVPRGISYDRVADALAALPGVGRVHDLHIWAMSTTEPVLTAHLVMPGGHPGDAFLSDARDMLAHRFGIGHATLQVETGGCAVECG
jgi:cobalt-zinc-cadmium efflux system protein